MLFASVTQLADVLVLETRSCGFKSHHSHQDIKKIYQRRYRYYMKTRFYISASKDIFGNFEYVVRDRLDREKRLFTGCHKSCRGFIDQLNKDQACLPITLYYYNFCGVLFVDGRCKASMNGSSYNRMEQMAKEYSVKYNRPYRMVNISDYIKPNKDLK